MYVYTYIRNHLFCNFEISPSGSLRDLNLGLLERIKSKSCNRLYKFDLRGNLRSPEVKNCFRGQ